jgi:hypothetical protein
VGFFCCVIPWLITSLRSPVEDALDQGKATEARKKDRGKEEK